MKSELWLHGPDDTGYEISDEELEVSESDEIALEKETRQNAMLVAPSESPLVEYERFSKFEKLLRVTALIIRFVSNLKSKTLAHGILPGDQRNLRQAHKLILSDLQKRSYSQELADLRSYGMVCKQSSLFTLAPFLDKEGVIRVKGGLGEANDLTYEEKHPIIILKGYVLFLLVKSQHENFNMQA
ncbi:retrovirus-related pol polyprotein from transposon 17.6 [Plakobranchus ocellatus]|uniref:Retrovirus-related pol polyprotein from transposon 17.6 n=1 Tax=Plakobranchus ocellatus TaxID=259542 RepID=A0AAV3ZUI5_9GAST|nr:retrovirus-related pol polyprotein from transposon 17.6 [Plakobranchus ocellatus]